MPVLLISNVPLPPLAVSEKDREPMHCLYPDPTCLLVDYKQGLWQCACSAALRYRMEQAVV